jgi:hypothetical protein
VKVGSTDVKRAWSLDILRLFIAGACIPSTNWWTWNRRISSEVAASGDRPKNAVEPATMRMMVHRTLLRADVRRNLGQAVSRAFPAKNPSLSKWGPMPRLWRAQVQKVRNVNQPQYWPDDSRDGEQLLVMVDMWNDDPHAATVGNQVADARGNHVPHPVSTGAVGQRDHVAVAAAEYIDGRFVDATAPPTMVNDDSESRKVVGERSGQVI